MSRRLSFTYGGTLNVPWIPQLAQRTVAANYAADSLGPDYIIGVTTGAPVTITLPDPKKGRVIIVKDQSGAGAATNNITVVSKNAETIDGAANKVISTNRGAVQFYGDGTVWYIASAS
jgi:hypothetical protein